MRTTLTLDQDVAAKLKSRARRLGKPFKEVVNEVLRTGFASEKPPGPLPPFEVKTRSMGLRSGISLDNISELLEQIEGPSHK
ncbi:MAG: DUF2191 domain-containing protein [Nitrospirae bacterium]|nr:DUF2191 domain-containing protein [Nitrospirota bacterium]